MTKHASKKQRKSQILDAARDSFAEFGYEATTVSQIANRAGLSKGSVYYHFSSKIEVLEELMERETTQDLKLISEAIESHDGPVEKIRTIGRHVLRQVQSDTPRLATVFAETSLRSPEAQQILQDHHEEYLEAIEDLLKQHRERLSNQDTEMAAVFVKSLIDGLQSVSMVDNLDMARFIRSASNILTEGIVE